MTQQLTSPDAAAISEAPVTPVSFADLGLSDDVLAAVADMGYSAPTPVQAASIPHTLSGSDVLAAAQTGTGKTAAFLLPTMSTLPHVPRTRPHSKQAAQGPLMLVVTPTRELAQQIENVCRAIAKRTGHRSVTVVGGVGYNPQKDALKRGCDILIATPGRLQDLIDQEACSLDQVQVLVLDEADRMLDMGFAPAVRRIVGYTREDRQTLLFSATLDESAVGAITDLVHDPARVEIAPAISTADTVAQYVLPVSLDAKNALLASVLTREDASRAIVFCRTKHRADACARRLARAGITCASIHGDRSQAQRMRALKDFRAGRCDVLVATDVLARGIDISDVRYVVNFDVPSDPVDYIHRIGRTGRAGEEGWSLTFVTREDVDEFYDIEALMGKTAELFDAEELELGVGYPEIDPERVPAKAPAGKKEKKRRRAKAARAERGSHRGGNARQTGAPTASAEAGESRESRGVRDAEGASSKPARRKRGGKTRVHAQDEADFELLSAAEARSAQRRNAARGRSAEGEHGERGREGRGRSARRADRGASAERRGGRREGAGAAGSDYARGERCAGRGGRDAARSGRAGSGERVAAATGGRRDAWRNYDEPSERRGRGGRGGHGAQAGHGASRREGRGSASRGTRGNAGGSSRRPGDRGGRR